MKAECQILINELKSIPDVFGDPQVLIRHLMVFRTNSQYEWFNCALIAQNERLKKANFSMVLSEEEWEQKFSYRQKLSGPGVQLLWPIVIDDELSWKVRTLYSIFDYGQKEPYLEYDFMAILKAASLMDLDSIIEAQKPGWDLALIDDYLLINEFYLSAEEDLRQFFKCCLLVSWGSLLEIDQKVNKKYLSLSIENREPYRIYQDLFQLITGFIPYFVQWMLEQQTKPVIRDLSTYTLQVLYGDQL